MVSTSRSVSAPAAWSTRDGAELPRPSTGAEGRSARLARDVPSLGLAGLTGWRSAERPLAGSRPTAPQIANEHYRIGSTPDGRRRQLRWSTIAGRELIADGRVGNELAVYEEYPAHPRGGRGPLAPAAQGAVVAIVRTSRPRCRPYRGALGERLVVAAGSTSAPLHPDHDPVARRRPGRLPHHRRRIQRLRPAAAGALAVSVPGAMPVSEVGDAVVGRGFGLMHDPKSTPVRRTSRGLPRCTRGRWTTPPTAGSGCPRRRASRVGDERIRHLRRRGGVPDRSGVRAAWRGTWSSRWSGPASPPPAPGGQAALRPPRGRLQPARHPHRARWTRTQRVHRRGAVRADPAPTPQSCADNSRSGAGTGLGPAPRRLAEEWVPDADLRGARALPVLVVAGPTLRRRAAGSSRTSRRRDRGLAAGADRSCSLRGAHRRLAQPRVPSFAVDGGRHPAHLVDAVVHGLAVGSVDRPAAAQRPGRVELPAAALDPHVRLRGGGRRRRLAGGANSPPVVRRFRARCWRGLPPGGELRRPARIGFAARIEPAGEVPPRAH